MEFLDEESRPRFLYHSRAAPSPQPEPHVVQLNKPSVYVSFPLALLLLALSIFFFHSEPLNSLLFWFALSLFLGPLAPSSLTGGDIRVGVGPIVEIPAENDSFDEEDSKKKKTPNRRSKARRPDQVGVDPAPVVDSRTEKSGTVRDSLKGEGNSGNGSVFEEEREWSEADDELLKKQLIKHPVGKPKRWEVIAEAFGGHGVESVIKRAKSSGEKKLSDSDSFARFLKDRKPVDKRVEEENEEIIGKSEGGEAMREATGGAIWSSGEDIALLNALKAFPKDAAMRWEKIAAAVPGKSKAACMKRIGELKRDFRSSKTSTDTQ